MARNTSSRGRRLNLSNLVGSLFPDGVASSTSTNLRDDPPPLLGSEPLAIQNAVPARQEEFTRGRGCAREALGRLGLSSIEIPIGPSREPVWPEGYVGSITHCTGFVGAVVAPNEVCAAIGLDAEPRRPLPTEIRRLVLTGGEATHVRERGDEGFLALTLFCAKEAIHKALFPGTRVWMDFLDVELRPGQEPGSWTATPVGTVAPGLERLVIRAVETESLVITGAFLPPL